MKQSLLLLFKYESAEVIGHLLTGKISLVLLEIKKKNTNKKRRKMIFEMLS